MKLIKRNCWTSHEYTCDLTRQMDMLSGLNKTDSYKYFYHYVLASKNMIKEKILAIRVPGTTIGNIYIDDNMRILRIHIDERFTIEIQPRNLNRIIKKFVGETIEL